MSTACRNVDTNSMRFGGMNIPWNGKCWPKVIECNNSSNFIYTYMLVNAVVINIGLTSSARPPLYDTKLTFFDKLTIPLNIS